VALNCASLSESILESELFGHEKGAFTGAERQRKGRFEFANGGTLFLDEVGDLPMSTQIKLLRVIESREIMRVGSNESIPVNVRLVSATNRDIEAMVAAGQFREDLYYRLKVVTIRLPPLRERRGTLLPGDVSDIELLSNHFCRDFAKQYGRPAPTISMAAMNVLKNYDWPGNVRQLRNTIESMIVMDADGRLDLDDLPEEMHVRRDGVSGAPPQESLVGKPLELVEAYYIEQALRLTEGNREEAARMLGVSERTMYRKIKEYKIPTVKGAEPRRKEAVYADVD
ncbi:MAG: sigma-54 interaction domain-containing protein, partial [Planctomycetia bacterium]